MERGLSRRSFLLGSLAAGMGASATLLAGCQAPASDAAAVNTEDIAWDFETDVLIAGAGAAGMTAAVAASENGVKTTVVDCNEEIGGSFILCQGFMASHAANPLYEEKGFSPTKEDFFIALTDTEDRESKRSDPVLVNAYLDASETQYDWYVKNGVEIAGTTASKEKNYDVSTAEGRSNMRYAGLVLAADENDPGPGYMYRLLPKSDTSGSGLIYPLQKAAIANGAEILQKHKLVKLYREKDGRVIGAQVEADGNLKNFKADKGVILCTGAWKGAKWIRKLYDPRLTDDIVGTAEPYALFDGSAITAALEVGATICSDGAADWHLFHRMGGTPYYRFPVGSTWAPPGYPLAPNVMKDGIFVNKSGERFANEMLGEEGDGWYNWALLTEDHLIWMIYDDEAAQSNGWTEVDPPQCERDWAFKADTIEELASMMGLPADAVAKTVSDYNSYVDSGIDPEWGRAAESMQAKIATPPFYALRTSIQIHDPAGGLYINQNCEVYDIYGNAIPGLYATGETAGGFHFISSSKALVQGRIAAMHASRQ